MGGSTDRPETRRKHKYNQPKDDVEVKGGWTRCRASFELRTVLYFAVVFWRVWGFCEFVCSVEYRIDWDWDWDDDDDDDVRRTTTPFSSSSFWVVFASSCWLVYAE